MWRDAAFNEIVSFLLRLWYFSSEGLSRRVLREARNRGDLIIVLIFGFNLITI